MDHDSNDGLNNTFEEQIKFEHVIDFILNDKDSANDILRVSNPNQSTSSCKSGSVKSKNFHIL